MSYELRESVPDPKTFITLREAADMGPRSFDAVQQGLSNTLYGVSIVDERDDKTVGMARVIGDGGCVYQVCDIVIHPAHQGQGLGSRMMDAVMGYIDENVPETAYVNLIADIDGFYEQWGFEPSAPASKAMYLRT